MEAKLNALAKRGITAVEHGAVVSDDDVHQWLKTRQLS
jgi:hypothetical protein